MANTASAKKMVRKIARRTEINKNRRSRMRTFVKKVEHALAAGNADEARAAFLTAQSEVMHAASNGIIHKNTAARKISRLNARVKALATA
ncbi:30S ribosomal protein S20 [Woodsholea maritima]|uniref:30S ribosomal protein S20 n=1 Tax=Woodsholea maritima TaxID=240237 RepID=UPI0003771A80|nr:30S ribosomal protein S20 [Woodsholea maritima]